ncbi:MAG: L,D-transpeptidase, partial [Bradyrhizobium sp.]
AKAALDRITIPQEVLDRIGPTAVPRSSIVISDEPLSAETNYRTEFVAVLSSQPQGGFITRKPTTDVLVSGDNFDDGYPPSFQRSWDPQASQPANTRRRSGQVYQEQQVPPPWQPQRWRW